MSVLKGSYSQKVPGLIPYSSENFHLGIEVEVAEDLLVEPGLLERKSAEMFKLLYGVVEGEIRKLRDETLDRMGLPKLPTPAGQPVPVKTAAEAKLPF